MKFLRVNYQSIYQSRLNFEIMTKKNQEIKLNLKRS